MARGCDLNPDPMFSDPDPDADPDPLDQKILQYKI